MCLILSILPVLACSQYKIIKEESSNITKNPAPEKKSKNEKVLQPYTEPRQSTTALYKPAAPDNRGQPDNQHGFPKNKTKKNGTTAGQLLQRYAKPRQSLSIQPRKRDRLWGGRGGEIQELTNELTIELTIELAIELAPPKKMKIVKNQWFYCVFDQKS